MTNDFEKVRIFLVEDHPVMRLGLKMMLLERGFEICGDVGTSEEALAMLPSIVVDVIIADLSLNGETAFSTLSGIRKMLPSTSIIVYSMHDSSLFVEGVLQLGVNGYVTKSDPVETLVEAITEVRSGKQFLGPTLAKSLEERYLPKGNLGSILKELSDREMQVLKSLGNGFGCHEIATQLELSSRTVETYCERLKNKLGVQNNRELIREAIRIIHPS